MSNLLPGRSRILVALASLVLLGAFVFPLWRIDLEAPQYPEGIGMVIRVHTVAGVKPQDLNNINGLNHYIGMKAIEPDAIPELQFMPWLVGALVVTGLVVATAGRRWMLVTWLALIAGLGVAGLVDFWLWGYDYGHNLDPHAIIQVPGMAYQPPLIGSKQLLNFTAYSWPDVGGVLLGIGFAFGIVALWLAYRGAPGSARSRDAAPVDPRASTSTPSVASTRAQVGPLGTRAAGVR